MSSLKILVYGQTTSRVAKLLWSLGELKAPFERDERSLLLLKQDAAYMAIQPKGTVPTLVVESGAGAQFVVNESNSGVAYLASKLGAGTFYPSTPEEVAKAWEWLEWGETSVAASLSPVWFGLVKRGGYPPGSPLVKEVGEDGVAVVVNGKSVSRTLGIWHTLERHLAADKRKFIMGEHLTMADITAGVHANRLFHLPFDEIGADMRTTLPFTRDYYQRLCERASYQEFVVPYGKGPAK
ncbi:glutathione S-transferase [Pavlovales sp. CCMP2436]|nr:glutathione S-transferase [Pavlovales sp. CCMP2436]|mmetsp:Transcript_34394/g.85759  ORF Transcript_34394/g.85759 Transcript_34394/m.85759 type:complete len:239 (-) Transcript_34394:128-844(-)